MNALHQDPPVRDDRERVVDVDGIPAHEQQRDAGRHGCAVCLACQGGGGGNGEAGEVFRSN